ncbi:MAG: hypothetical protein WDW38_006658 [Sanguina aurantia]
MATSLMPSNDTHRGFVHPGFCLTVRLPLPSRSSLVWRPLATSRPRGCACEIVAACQPAASRLIPSKKRS